MLNDQEKSLEKLSAIEKIINEIVELRQKVIEFKEIETQRQIEIESLVAREKKYRTIFENIPQKLYIKDRNSIYVLCSKNYAADLKIEPDEISGKTDYDFYPTDLAEKYVSDDRRIMGTGSLEEIDEKYIHDGQEFIIHTVKNPICDEKGDLTGILGIFWDISEQKRTAEESAMHCLRVEEHLSKRTAELQALNEHLQIETAKREKIEESFRRSEQKNRSILENAATGVVIFDEESLTIVQANPEFEEICGFSSDEVEGNKSITEFVAKEDLERCRDYTHAWKTGGQAPPHHFECRLIDRQGNIKPISMKISAIPGTKENVAFFSDISHYVSLQESFQALEGKYQVLVKNAQEAILVIQDGLARLVNGKILEILGYAKDELSSVLFKKFIHPEDREMVELHLKKVTEEGLPRIFSSKLIRKDGGIRWLENRVSSIQWEGKPAVLNFMMDITDRRQAQEELQSAIAPFRTIVNAMEKILSALNREFPDRETR